MSQLGLQSPEDTVPSQMNLRIACNISFISLRLSYLIQILIAISLELGFEVLTGQSHSAAMCFFASSKSSGYSSLWLCGSLNGMRDAVFGQLAFRGLLECS